MATLWERAAHLVNRVFSLLCLFVALVVSQFWFRGQDIGSDCVSPWSLLAFYFLNFRNVCITSKLLNYGYRFHKFRKLFFEILYIGIMNWFLNPMSNP